MLDSGAIERRHTIKAIDVHHKGFVAAFIRSASKGLDAAIAAELVIDLVRVEVIGRQMIGAALEHEIGGRNRLHDPAQPPAA